MYYLLSHRRRVGVAGNSIPLGTPIGYTLHWGRMATATATVAATASGESEALRIAFSYLSNSIDVATLLPVALSRGLITGPQRTDCLSEPEPYRRAEKFLGHLQRAVNGDSNRFHIFVLVLSETGLVTIASRLNG